MATKLNKEELIKSLQGLDWFEHDAETGKSYIKFDEIRITEAACEYCFNSTVIWSMNITVPLRITGIECRMATDFY